MFTLCHSLILHFNLLAFNIEILMKTVLGTASDILSVWFRIGVFPRNLFFSKDKSQLMCRIHEHFRSTESVLSEEGCKNPTDFFERNAIATGKSMCKIRKWILCSFKE